jgi:predicted homoserine dehydrogenase-like protein
MLKQALDRRAEEGRPIEVGFVGAGRHVKMAVK